MAMHTPSRNTDYDEIKDNSSWDEKLNVAINIIRKTSGPTVVDYNKLKISWENYGLFDAKLKKTNFVRAETYLNAYYPNYFISDEGFLKLEQYGSYINFIKSNEKKEAEKPKNNNMSGSDVLSQLSKPFVNKCLFVHRNRIDALGKIRNSNFDLSKLLRLCKEINDNYELENYFAVGALVRGILDHIPPLLGKNTFSEVANNYGGRSFKEIMIHLEKVSKNIGNIILHAQVKLNETLPNENTVDCKNALDTLFGEIINKLKIP